MALANCFKAISYCGLPNRFLEVEVPNQAIDPMRSRSKNNHVCLAQQAKKASHQIETTLKD